MKLSLAFLITIISLLIIYNCKNSSPTKSDNTTDPSVITFSDENFENLIRDILYKYNGGIRKQDMMQIINLSGYEREINNIDGVENCENLERINLRTNQISDISGIAELTKIYRINLWTNQITDISALSGLTNLNELYLGGNQISDIDPLVQNQGLGAGDKIVISNNPLSETSLNDYIPQLIARGVEIHY